MKYSSLSTSAAVLKKRFKYLQLYTKINDITPIDPKLIEDHDWEHHFSELKKEYLAELNVSRFYSRSGKSMAVPRRHQGVQNVRRRRKSSKGSRPK